MPPAKNLSMREIFGYVVNVQTSLASFLVIIVFLVRHTITDRTVDAV